MFGIAICSNPCPPQIIPLYPPLVKGEVGKFVNGASLPSPTRGEGLYKRFFNLDFCNSF